MFYPDIWNLIISQLDVAAASCLAASCKSLHEHIWKSYDFSVGDYYIWRCAVANRCQSTIRKLLTLTRYQWPVSDGLIYAMLFDDAETVDLMLEHTLVRDIHLSLAIALNDAALLKVLLDSCGEDHPLLTEHIRRAECETEFNIDVIDVIRQSRCYRSLKYESRVAPWDSDRIYWRTFIHFPEVHLIEMGPLKFFRELRAKDLIRLPFSLQACRDYSSSLEDADELLGYLRWLRRKPGESYHRMTPLSEEEAEFLRLLRELHSDLLIKWRVLPEDICSSQAYVECRFNEYGIYRAEGETMYNFEDRSVELDKRRDASSLLKPLAKESSDWENEGNCLSEEIRAGRLCEWKLMNTKWTRTLQRENLEYWEAVACDVARCYSVLVRD